MAERCATCAFRAGTDASRSPITQLRAKLCIISGDYFLCHESPLEAWCAGVAESLGARRASGKLDFGSMEAELARRTLDFIDDVLDGKLSDAELLSRGFVLGLSLRAAGGEFTEIGTALDRFSRTGA
jgi:hypothetical protein